MLFISNELTCFIFFETDWKLPEALITQIFKHVDFNFPLLSLN